MNIKVMSYNTQHCLNFVTQQIDYDIIVDTIKRCGADIVGLQEIRDEGESEEYEAQAKILAERLGFYYYFAKAIDDNGPNPYGNAIISRYPILSAQTLLIPDPEPRAEESDWYETRCILKAKIDVGKGLNMLITHFGVMPDEQVNAAQTVATMLPSERGVLMGDFNVEPDDAVLNSIKEKLYDTADKFSAPKLSFPSDAPEKKIDYIFTTRDLKVLSADIPEIVSSDHRPHTAVIEIG